MNVHDAGAASDVDVIFSGVTLFFDSRLLNSTRPMSSIVFQPFTVAVNSLQPDSHVSISALVGGMSMPFCVSGPRTVLSRLLIATNDNRLPGTRAGAPNLPPPPPRPPPRCTPPNVASFASRADAAVESSGGNEPFVTV